MTSILKRYVLPPAAADVLDTVSTWTDENQTLKDYAYIYKYDGRSRCMLKKPPGNDPIEMRYDRADRLIFSQDGKRLARSEWSFFFLRSQLNILLL